MKLQYNFFLEDYCRVANMIRSTATVVLVTVLIVAVCGRLTPEPKASPEMIDYINNEAHTTWKAGVNFRDGASLEYVQGLLGWNFESEFKLILPPATTTDEADIEWSTFPDEFDARTNWPECELVIGEVRDQGSCRSCWAIGTTGAMSDRLCIFSNGTINVTLSAEDLLSCCFYCGPDRCHGGNILTAYVYYSISGLVTGGNYNSKQGCRPYSIAGCEHGGVNGTLPPCGHIVPTPPCVQQCDASYPTPYKCDKHHGELPYSVSGHEDTMKREIMTHGPITVGFFVYEDFPSYKTGVYQHVTGAQLGGLVVKIIGWGVENGTPYWLCVNSWNQDWGDKGFFKILRGKNECGIEFGTVTSLPRL